MKPRGPKNPHYTRRPDWMGEIAVHICDVPLCRCAIPGAHNAASYSLSADSGYSVEPDIPRWIRKAGPLAKPLVAPWARCQNLDIYSQLETGIRYFDLRVCAARDGELRTCHGLAGCRVFDVIEEVARFSAAHAREIIVLDFHLFFGMNRQRHEELSSRVLSLFGDRLVPASATCGATPGELWAAGRNVIVLYDYEPAVRECGKLWSQENIVSPWPNAQTAAKLKRRLSGILHRRHTDSFHVLQCTVTPDAGLILSGALPFAHGPHSLEDAARSIAPKISRWLRNSRTGGTPNIFYMDFVEYSDIVEMAVEMNTGST